MKKEVPTHFSISVSPDNSAGTKLKKYAKNMNNKLANAANVEVAKNLQKQSEFMQLCLEYKVNNSLRYGYLVNSVQMLTLDTDERNMAWFKFDSNISGSSSETYSDDMDKAQYCSMF